MSHNFYYLIGPIGIGILPMYRVRFWRLLISFHVPLRCTFSREHSISYSLLATDLLSKIHRLIDWSLILKTKLHLSLLESRSLMILLSHLWKDKMPCPSIVNVHRRRPCRWLIIGCHHCVDIPCLSHKPLMCRQWIHRCVGHLEHWHLKVSSKRPHSSGCGILRILSHQRF